MDFQELAHELVVVVKSEIINRGRYVTAHDVNHGTCLGQSALMFRGDYSDEE